MNWNEDRLVWVITSYMDLNYIMTIPYHALGEWDTVLGNWGDKTRWWEYGK